MRNVDAYIAAWIADEERRRAQAPDELPRRVHPAGDRRMPVRRSCTGWVARAVRRASR